MTPCGPTLFKQLVSSVVLSYVQHRTRSSFTCKTRNLVYLIQCGKCDLQYISENANLLHIRMNGHRSDINTKKTDKPVVAHFKLPDHSLDDLHVMRIEKIHANDATTQDGETPRKLLDYLYNTG